MSDDLNPRDDPRFIAAIELLRRCGLAEFRLHFTEEEQPPIAFVAQGRFNARDPSGSKLEGWESAAAQHPTVAVFRLCAQVMDGGMCTHCDRPSGFSEHFDEELPGEDIVCWYRWDPELATFRRGCE